MCQEPCVLFRFLDFPVGRASRGQRRRVFFFGGREWCCESKEEGVGTGDAEEEEEEEEHWASVSVSVACSHISNLQYTDEDLFQEMGRYGTRKCIRLCVLCLVLLRFL